MGNQYSVNDFVKATAMNWWMFPHYLRVGWTGPTTAQWYTRVESKVRNSNRRGSDHPQRSIHNDLPLAFVNCFDLLVLTLLLLDSSFVTLIDRNSMHLQNDQIVFIQNCYCVFFKCYLFISKSITYWLKVLQHPVAGNYLKIFSFVFKLWKKKNCF